jgi:TPR repeat protein
MSAAAEAAIRAYYSNKPQKSYNFFEDFFWDAEKCGSGPWSCSRASCPNSAQNLRCSGCEAPYCSLECSETNWPDHVKKCILARRSRSYNIDTKKELIVSYAFVNGPHRVVDQITQSTIEGSNSSSSSSSSSCSVSSNSSSFNSGNYTDQNSTGGLMNTISLLRSSSLQKAKKEKSAENPSERDLLFAEALTAKGRPEVLREQKLLRDIYRDADMLTLSVAAVKGDGAAQTVLGDRLISGTKGVAQDGIQASIWLSRASTQGVIAAQVLLGIAYLYGRAGLPRDPLSALEFLLAAAIQGSAAAQGALGECYEKGLGVPKDIEIARSFYARSAANGYEESRDSLSRLDDSRITRSGGGGGGGGGLLLEDKQGEIPSSTEAAAAASILLQSCNNDGVDGLPAEREAISVWGKVTLADLKRAAKRGDPAAQQVLGARYHEGDGVRQDYAQAALWYGKAAAQGFARAQLDLGTLHAQGLGMPLDYSEAVRWFRMAAERGDSLALYTLGACYEDGSGVEPDIEQACYWYRRAAEQGFEAARDTLRELGKLR